ncbi:hypothetical protein B296_00057959 [Ensete ventricosum]|uniref:Uncharacterized protein n=1 Tax=Ensete ventricosum TaxID=4639 RepID=A0A426WWS3_ENSVE|nr:hypothetical protein B296_00057959 [Ensete ventricosum]
MRGGAYCPLILFVPSILCGFPLRCLNSATVFPPQRIEENPREMHRNAASYSCAGVKAELADTRIVHGDYEPPACPRPRRPEAAVPEFLFPLSWPLPIISRCFVERAQQVLSCYQTVANPHLVDCPFAKPQLSVDSSSAKPRSLFPGSEDRRPQFKIDVLTGARSYGGMIEDKIKLGFRYDFLN